MEQRLRKLQLLTFLFSCGVEIPYPPAQQKSPKNFCDICYMELTGKQRMFCSPKHTNLFWYRKKNPPKEIKKAFSFKKKRFEKPKLYKNYQQTIFLRDAKGNPLEKKIIPVKVSKWAI